MFENAVPLLYENDNAELCFELFIWRQWKVTDPVTLFFPVPLIKGSVHPWDRWIRMEFIYWMLPRVRHMPGSQEIWRDWFEFCPWEAIVEAFLPLKIKLVWITNVHSWELRFSWSTLPPAPVSIFSTSLHLALICMWNSIPCLVYIINQLPPSVHEIDPEYLEVTMKISCAEVRLLQQLSFSSLFLILYSPLHWSKTKYPSSLMCVFSYFQNSVGSSASPINLLSCT